MQPHLQFFWTWIVRVFIGLGGLAGINKIYEWLLRGPKIVGEIQSTIIGSLVRTSDNAEVGGHVLALIYLVNKRINPATIKNFELSAKIDGRWVKVS